MKAHLMAIAASLSFALTASATDVPRFETYFGFDWVRFNPDVTDIPSFHGFGGSAQFMYNFSKGIGLTVDVGAVTKDTFDGFLTNRQFHLLAGPHYAYHNHTRLTPFVEVLFGAADSSVSLDISDINRVPAVLPSSSITVPPDIDASAKLSLSKTSFAMMAGGGLDIRLTKRITYRLFDADYYLCRPTSLLTGDDVNRNNFRLTTGVNFTWGAR
jgi:hypothetical protein